MNPNLNPTRTPTEEAQTMSTVELGGSVPHEYLYPHREDIERAVVGWRADAMANAAPQSRTREASNEPFVYNAIALTPEMILALVRRRLASADDQITAVMDTIDDSNRRSERYARQQQLLLALRNKVQGEHGGKPNERFSINEFNDDGSEQITIGDETRTLEEWLESTGLTYGDLGVSDGKITLDQLETALDRVKEKARTEASGSEMNMLQLQQLMQQRSQIIQLGTNLSKKLFEGENAIVNNLR